MRNLATRVLPCRGGEFVPDFGIHEFQDDINSSFNPTQGWSRIASYVTRNGGYERVEKIIEQNNMRKVVKEQILRGKR